MGINEKTNQTILDNDLLNFHLSYITSNNFEYEPNEKTNKYIWRYLSSANLIQVNDIENEDIILTYEQAAAQDSFQSDEIFTIYLKINFNFNQLVNAEEVYKNLPNYKARALIYQSTKLNDNVEKKIYLALLLKELFIKDNLLNIYDEELSDILFLNNCFYPTDNNRIISKKNFNRMDLEINEDAFVFCSLNNSYKITAQEIEVWSRVLLNVKNSFLVLLSNNQEMKKNIIAEVIKNKINPDCIKFVEYLDYENHMARHLIFDLFLDSFNYNAHTSAVDSLWAGLPILTKVGKSFSSRICGSILNSVGLSNLITYSKEEYEQKAIYFGNNKKEILKIKNSILESKKKKYFMI